VTAALLVRFLLTGSAGALTLSFLLHNPDPLPALEDLPAG
jgi:hypothetical protein